MTPSTVRLISVQVRTQGERLVEDLNAVAQTIDRLHEVADSAERDLRKAKSLLARAHGLLEMNPDYQKLPQEIADFLGFASEHEAVPSNGTGEGR